ncbi:malto-oligosyltrehalose synthase [Herbaspirillum sp. meg3]|uniref:malto-oligosyltrehalose synthase n=1 Tax=Herbaspirillum sp. meg3 TaxID=2025949 RepID=UPI000B991633|nr:malto-oligosyltrehalose synthase [Herbaspirillum sp. meg3]ASU38824.1 malto-oligosyltrehalose synthase [Herbaspirillum sp. meg3]
MPTSNPQQLPRPLQATLRIQFHRGFTFDDALAQCDYFAALGVSHLYASPIFTARSGSTHGYDVVDPGRVNPELGGEEGLRRLVQGLHARQMGLIVDIVPNHMAVDGQNPWWYDILLWGQHSRHASWFDIEWLGADPALHGKVLLPVLGKPYGQLLRDAEIGLGFDVESARLYVAIPGNRLPVAPEDYVEILSAADSPYLTKSITAFERVLDAAVQEERQTRAEQAWRELATTVADVEGMASLHTALATFSAATPHGAQALHALLERQHYRLTDWRNAGDEINWRRFFEIGDLIGMRVEQVDVFEATHAGLFRLYEEGLIDGVRIDHIDGLADPAAYVRRLRERLQGIRRDIVPYIIAEKILAPDESLRNSWSLDGTTGYDFMDQAGAVLHDGEGAAALDTIWKEYRADPDGFDYVVLATRRRLLTQNFASEFNALTATLHALARTSVATRDISLMSIRRCMLELLAYFPVYRSYGDHDGCDSRDGFLIRTTAARVRDCLRKQDLPTLDAIAGWLADAPEPEKLQGLKNQQHQEGHAANYSQLHWRALTRFQQLTPPLTAKSTEDTAFYRYGRLLSRNEVGSDPAQLALPVEDFHRDVLRRQRDFPRSMLATATHDHKRGEDARMRLAVLSEIPAHWQQALQRWRALNTTARQQAPIDPVDELMLYQTLVGVWPLPQTTQSSPSSPSGESHSGELTDLIRRVSAWQRKALREAKRRTDWNAPDPVYEGHCEAFLQRILRSDTDNPFLPALRAFVQEISAAGALNSLSQTMLRLTAPGIPDLYQGCDLWDFSLVDPDNRRPVDYALRQALMARNGVRALTLEDWRRGDCKQQLIRTLLHFRSGREALFTTGDYLPLTVDGELAEHLLAFARSAGDVTVVVLCSRHAARLIASGHSAQSLHSAVPLIPPQRWADTAVHLPLEWTGGEWQSILSGMQGAIREQYIDVADVLRSFPVDVLVLSRGGGPIAGSRSGAVE